jgi:biopolymer transport protein ExbB
LTTAAGLLVAIPALIAYLYFVSRVDKLLIQIDRLAERVVGLIASDGWDEESQKSEKRSRRTKAA